MADLGVDEDVPQIEVWNKVDQLDPDRRAAFETQAERSDDVVAISALTGEGLDRLYDAIDTALTQDTTDEVIELAFADGRKRAWLHEAGVVQSETQSEDGWRIEVRWNAKQAAQYRKAHA
jgi:GTP-binding protein HflX